RTLERVDDLQDSRINPFSARTGQRHLRHYVRLDADKAQFNWFGRITLEVSGRGLAGLKSRGVLFVHVGSHLQMLHIAENERGGFGCRRGVFTWSHIYLE